MSQASQLEGRTALITGGGEGIGRGLAAAFLKEGAVFLASEGARYLTGNTLFVDGGTHMNGSTWAPELAE